MTKERDRERAFATLDRVYADRDPQPGAGDSALRDEMTAYFDGHFKWCELGGFGAERRTTDTWERVGRGRQYELAANFLGHRAAWAADRAERLLSDGDPRAAQMGKVAAEWRKGDTFWHAKVAAEDARAVCSAPPSAFDRDPWTVGTPLGVCDLRDGSIVGEREEFWGQESPAPGLMVTRVTGGIVEPAHFDSDALGDLREPRWGEFVLEVCSGDAEKAAFLKRAIGYSLYGGNPLKAVFVLLGGRDTGKSTLMGAVDEALGAYAYSAPPSFLAISGGSHDDARPDPVLAALPGVRLVDVGEMDRAARLDESKLKRLSSGSDKVTCRTLHKEPFTYKPQFTIWMHLNALPKVEDTTAIEDGRMFVIPFERHFGPEERDLTLGDRLASEAGRATVLAWAIEGFQDWLARGMRLDPPEAVREATAAWAGAAGDPFERFVKERCELGAGLSCDVRDFREAYESYCRETGQEADERPATAQQINRRLAQMNVDKRPSHGRQWYRGVRLSEGAVKEK